MHGGISNEHSPTSVQHQRHTNRARTFFCIQYFLNILKSNRPIARHTCNKRIRMTMRDHTRCKNNPIIIHHSQTITAHIAFTLQTLIEIISIKLIMLRFARILNFKHITIFNTGPLKPIKNTFFTAHKNRMPKSHIIKCIGSANNLLFFPFSKNNPAWVFLNLLKNTMQPTLNRIKPC